MSLFRKVLVDAYKNGRVIIDRVLQRAEVVKHVPKGKDPIRFEPEKGHKEIFGQVGLRKETPSGFAKYLYRSSVKSFAADLRRQAALRFQSPLIHVRPRLNGTDKYPLYAFAVGLTLAARSQLHSEVDHDGFDDICDNIKDVLKDTFKTPYWQGEDRFDSATGSKSSDYEFGPYIAKGSCAAVYEARLREEDISSDSTSESSLLEDGESGAVTEEESSSLSEFSTLSSQESLLESFDCSDLDSLDELEIVSDPHIGAPDDMDLAVKIMFNYEESMTHAILNTMESEMVPARETDEFSQMGVWENGNHVKKKRLKPHPNIVDIKGVFVDDMPYFPDALQQYPDALPPRLNPDGSGRNKTLFLVMKRYGETLDEYLQSSTPSLNESLAILAQLVEGVVHMTEEQVAHRDIKSDNVLVTVQNGSLPLAVISDFGLCLADEWLGLRVPYVTNEISKGGNGDLMAPEIASVRAGYSSFLDYRKSDLWAVGTLAYEIFGCQNPFHRDRQGWKLHSETYQDKDLPEIPDCIPDHVKNIVRLMLVKDPSQRPSATQIADMLHILLWAPTPWIDALRLGSPPPNRKQMKWWILTLWAGLICQRLRLESDDDVEYQLKTTFLSRLSFDGIMEAVERLWSL